VVDKQRMVKLSLSALEHAAKRIVAFATNNLECRLTITLLTNDRMRDVNRFFNVFALFRVLLSSASYYRGLNKPTDVISISPSTLMQPGMLPPLVNGERCLGDLFIGMRYVQRHCIENKLHLMPHMHWLVTHGMRLCCHVPVH
jgi:ssRNA-specific RNase YbeY (16S rRNA maturation enzyme)